MPLAAAIGQSFALDGREACIQAIDQALQSVGQSESVSLAFLFVSKEHAMQEVMRGATIKLRNTPLFGFSTVGQITPNGQQQRSIIAALLFGKNIQIQAQWWPDFAKDSPSAIRSMLEALNPLLLTIDESEKTLLLFADGVSGDSQQLCKNLPKGKYVLGGGLTGSNLRQTRSFQIGGARGGEGGLAAALLYGRLKTGIGVAHGWQSIGKYFTISRVEGPWVRTLDDLPASETYAHIFGQPSREWVFPPLNELVRLYPMGIEQNQSASLLVRSPLQVEVDGSFRMTSTVPEGSKAHLLVGSTPSCMQAVQQAGQQALQALGEAKPVLALVFADIAWRMLFESQPGKEIAALREILGEDIPIAGGYTVGQLAAVAPFTEPKLLNQHIEIILFGDSEQK